MKYIYTSHFYSDAGIEYYLRILDSLAIADVADTFYSSNLTIQYNADDEERLTAIISSELKFDFLIENTTQLAVIKDITETNDRYFIELKKGVDLEFFGKIFIDNFTESDESFPYEFSITATDGLKELKEVNFGEQALYEDSLLNIIFNMLNKNTYYSTYYTTSAMLRVALNWLPANGRTDGSDYCVLEYSKVVNYTFASTLNNETDFNKYSAFEVINFIISRFNARLFYAAGFFNIVSVGNYRNNSFYYQNYDSAAGAVAHSTITPLLADINRLSGGEFSYYRNVATAYQKLLIAPNVNLLPPDISNTIFTTLIDSRAVSAGDSIILSGNLWTSVDMNYVPNHIIPIRFRYKIYIINGTKSLGGEYGAPAWQNNTTSYYKFESAAIYDFIYFGTSAPQRYLWVKVDLSQILPALPLDGILQVKIELDNYRLDTEEQSVSNILPTGFFLNQAMNPAALKKDSSPNDFTTAVFSESVVGSDSKNSFTMGDQLLSDSDPSLFFSTIKVQNNLGIWNISGGWKDREARISTPEIDIFSLAIKDFLYDQQQGVRKYSGGIISNGNFFNSYSFDGYDWVILSGVYSYDMDEWEGEFFVIDKSDKTITTDISNSSAILQGGDASIISSINNLHSAVKNIVATTKITELTAAVSGTITSLPVSNIEEATLGIGDVIILIHPDGLHSQNFTVSAAQGAAATTINVDSTTLGVEYPTSSQIKINHPLLSRMVKHKMEGTIAGAAVTAAEINGDGLNFNFSTGNLTSQGTNINFPAMPVYDVSFALGRLYKDENGFIKIIL